MFDQMRRKDRAISLEEIKEILFCGEYGILSTMGEDGWPYGVPVNFAYDGENVYFHSTCAMSHRNANLAYLSKVCFTVVGDTQLLPEKFSTKYESAMVFGEAAVVEDFAEKKAILEMLVEKYAPDFWESGAAYIVKACGQTEIYKITPEKITGKARRK